MVTISKYVIAVLCLMFFAAGVAATSFVEHNRSSQPCSSSADKQFQKGVVAPDKPQSF